MDNRNAVIIPMLLLGSFLILGGCSSSSSDDPPPPNPAGTLQFSSATYAGPEGTANIVVTVTRTGGTQGAVSVDYATSDGTATVADLDYTAIPATTLNWADTEGADQTFNVVVNTTDTNPELTEDLTVTLSNVVTADLGSVNSAVISITDDDSVTIIGTVTGPGASLAMVEPSLGDRLLAGLSSLFFGVVEATIGDPVPGATVTVYEVDNVGAIVGTAITTSTTDGAGAYTLAAPLDAPASKYIVRATDGVNDLDGRISATTTNVDPVSDATSFVIADRSLDLTALSAAEVAVIQEQIDDAVVHVDSTGTASAVSAALVTEAGNRRGTNNIINSSTQPGSVCGTVTKGGGATNMANIEVVARGDVGWETRAKTYTLADGSYCLNVPAGDYIVNAVNSKSEAEDPDKSASEWRNAAGTGRTILEADAITVGVTAVNNIDFDLAPGARIEGTMTTFDAGSAEGVVVFIRDNETFNAVTTARVESNNTFRVNVPAGDYTVYARNTTLAAPYATQMYGAATAYNTYRNAAARVTLTAGDTQDAGMSLGAGNLLSGTILDAPAGNPVSNSRVRINTQGDVNVGGAVTRVRTHNAGTYRIWLKPDSYSVDARGSGGNTVDLSASDQTFDYSVQRAVINGIVQDGNTNPVGMARVLLYVDPAGTNTYTLINQELSNSDGSFTLYGDPATDYQVLYRIDGQYTHGSIVRPNATTINGGTTYTTNADIMVVNDLGTQTLPTVGVGGGMGWIVGTLAANGTTGIQGGQQVQIRENGGGGTTRFFRTRTHGDGTYRAAVPSGISYRVRMVGTTNHDNVAVTNNAETIQNHP